MVVLLSWEKVITLPKYAIGEPLLLEKLDSFIDIKARKGWASECQFRPSAGASGSWFTANPTANQMRLATWGAAIVTHRAS